MSGLLGAKLQTSLNLSLGYQQLPIVPKSGTISTSLDMVSVWNKYVKTPYIPQNFNLDTPSTSYSPAFGKTVSNKGSTPLISGLQIDALKVAGYLVPAAKVVNTVAAINLGTNLSVTRTDNLTFSELNGTVTINGTQVPFEIGTSGSTTAYVNIPSTAGSTVSVSVGNFKLKNDFYTQFGLTANPYVEVEGKVPFWGKVQVYRKDFTPINVTVFSTQRSSLGMTSANTITGTIKVTKSVQATPMLVWQQPTTTTQTTTFLQPSAVTVLASAPANVSLQNFQTMPAGSSVKQARSAVASVTPEAAAVASNQSQLTSFVARRSAKTTETLASTAVDEFFREGAALQMLL